MAARPAEPLYEVIKHSLGINADLDLCAHVFSRLGGDRARIAQLSKLVTQAARAGDAQSLAHPRDAAAAEFALLVDATRRQLGFTAAEPVPVSYSGGVFEHVGAMLSGEHFTTCLHAYRRRLPGLRTGVAARHRRRAIRRKAARPALVERGHRAAARGKRGSTWSSSNREACDTRLRWQCCGFSRPPACLQRSAGLIHRWRILPRSTRSMSMCTSTPRTRHSSIRRRPTISGC